MDPFNELDHIIYKNNNKTGVGRLLEQQNKLMQEASRAVALDIMMNDISDLKFQINELECKMHRPWGYTSIESHNTDTSEPSIEGIKSLKSPNWFTRIINDPIWEIFKRPTMK